MNNRYGFVEENQAKKDEKEEKSKKQAEYYIKFSISSTHGQEKTYIKEIQRKDRNFELGRQIVCEIFSTP